MKAKLGIAPIAWWNDDLPELSDDVSLEECLRQAGEAGFTGMETGRRFPMDATVLGPILKAHKMSVCGGWFSGLLLDGDMEEEKQRIAEQMALFGAKIALFRSASIRISPTPSLGLACTTTTRIPCRRQRGSTNFRLKRLRRCAGPRPPSAGG